MPHYIDIHVGKRLRLQRIIAGLTQADLAKKSGVTYQQVQKYERGFNRISASRLYDFSLILGVTMDYFYDDLEGKVEKAVTLVETDLFSRRETLELLRCYHDLPLDLRQKFHAFICNAFQ